MSKTFVSAKYDASILTVDYLQSDGTHLLRTGGTIAWRFNNPGNIRPAKSGRLIMGAIGIGKTKSNGSFLIFASYEAGREQKRSLLRRKYNDRTIYTMLAGVPDKNGNLIMGYAPASDKNDPQAYAAAISKHANLPENKVLSELTEAELEKVLDAMEIKEGFHGQKKTRQEVWLPVTNVTVSNGSVGVSDVPVKVKIGDQTLLQKTNKQGRLPPIVHVKLGQKVELYSVGLGDAWRKQFEFVTSNISNAFVFIEEALTFRGISERKNSANSQQSGRKQPFKYVVQMNDTIGKIITRFKCTVSELKEWNPDFSKNGKIFIGQVLGIYGRITRSAQNSRQVSDPVAFVTRSKEGKGAPLAIFNVSQKQAPWMQIAIGEAKRWAGRDEKTITKYRNYHQELGSSGSLHRVPWCASFANYCLKNSGAAYENSASSQFPVNSTKFVKIDRPVYGALMVLRNYYVDDGAFAGTGHVTFVYGKTSGNKIAGLGGNQKDRVKISIYASSGVSSEFKLNGRRVHQKLLAFYVPASYIEFAIKDGPLQVVDSEEVNRVFLGVANAKIGANENTR